MLTQFISDIAVKVLETAGYAGAGGLMALESMIAPVPSEAVMPFVGMLVEQGKWNFGLAVLATSLGSLAGSLASYVMGFYGGKPLVLKVGKYLFLNQRDLEKTELFFHKNRGIWIVFASRFIPVVRHFISIPAGIGKMPLVPFMLVSVIGATLWNTFLLFCGMKLQENWKLVQKYSHQADIVIVAGILVGMVWFIRKRMQQNKTPVF